MLNCTLVTIFYCFLVWPANTVGFRPVISQKAKCEFITLKHNSMNVYINWITFRQFWVHFLSKRVKKLIILQHFFSNLLSKITSLRCNTTLLYRKAKMLFGPYFQEKTGSAASYCSLKVTKPPESFKIEAKYAKHCFRVWSPVFHVGVKCLCH